VADKGDELVHYITKRVVNYMKTPKEERKQYRELRRSKESWVIRWFGVVPFALSMWLEQRKEKLKRVKGKRSLRL
jgi:hypothetical protein